MECTIIRQQTDTLQGFMQESSRGDRHGCMCVSILCTLPADTAHSDQKIKDFIKVETCRRQYLIKIFFTEKYVRKYWVISAVTTVAKNSNVRIAKQVRITHV